MGQEFGVVPDGRLDLPVDEAYAKAVALDERRFAFDFRPLSHLWQVMAGN